MEQMRSSQLNEISQLNSSSKFISKNLLNIAKLYSLIYIEVSNQASEYQDSLLKYNEKLNDKTELIKKLIDDLAKLTGDDERKLAEIHDLNALISKSNIYLV